MKRWIVGFLAVAGVGANGMGQDAFAQAVNADLRGFEEVPAVSSEATGRFRGRLEAGRLGYKLTYRDLEGDVTEAHIHFGQAGANGGISVFLCDTPASPDPTGQAPSCPDEGTVTGEITRENVIGPAGQGIEPEEFRALAQAIRSGLAYVNVHSTKFPNGEIRGQLDFTGPPGP
ncbi:MAG TPA: CHRD domain-containing protein [Candidatus Eisenbacteria bacterium]|nr:CHRD domain-containing protein [Candidatus Eisenbacteria bacterium]